MTDLDGDEEDGFDEAWVPCEISAAKPSHAVPEPVEGHSTDGNKSYTILWI